MNTRALAVFLVAALTGCSTSLVALDGPGNQEIGNGRIDYSTSPIRLSVVLSGVEYTGSLDDGGSHEGHKTTRVIPFVHEIEHKGTVRSAGGSSLQCLVSSRTYGHKGSCVTEDGREITLHIR